MSYPHLNYFAYICSLFCYLLIFCCNQMFAESNLRTNESISLTSASARLEQSYEEAIFCPAAVFDGIVFSRSLACSDLTLPCPNPEITKGHVLQHCDCKTAQWLPNIDYSNCSHLWIDYFTWSMIQNESVDVLSEKIVQNLKPVAQHHRLYSADIPRFVNVIGEMLDFAEMQLSATINGHLRTEKASIFVENLGIAGDYLLAPENEKIWSNLQHHLRLEAASSLLTTLERMASVYASYTDQVKVTRTYNCWALQVQIKELKYSHQNIDYNGNNDDSDVDYDDSDADYDNYSESEEQLENARKRRNAYVQAELLRNESSNQLGLSKITPQFGHIPRFSNEYVRFTNFAASPILTMPSDEVLRRIMERKGESQLQPKGPTPYTVQLSRTLQIQSNSNALRMAYCVFDGFSTLLQHTEKTIINGLIMSANVNSAKYSIQLPEENPVTFKFNHLITQNVENPRCVFWNVTSRSWSELGCRLIHTTINYTKCSCSHLTSFTILMDIVGDGEELSDSTILTILTITGCTLSIICLSVNIIVFSCFRSLKNIRHSIHRNLCTNLLIAEILFLFGIDATWNRTLCSLITLGLHYFFLCAFSWMLIEGYHLYTMLTKVFDDRNSKMLRYSSFGFGFPVVVVFISAGSGWMNYGTMHYCWLNVKSPIIWSFAGPVFIVLLANVFVLVIALKSVLTVERSNQTRFSKVVGWLKGSAMLVFLLGLTWIFGFLVAIFPAKFLFATIFTILNSAQGVFIFVFHVLLNEKVITTLKQHVNSNLTTDSDDRKDNRNIQQNIMSFTAKFCKNGRIKPKNSAESSAMCFAARKKSIDLRNSTDASETMSEINTTLGSILLQLPTLSDTIKFDDVNEGEVYG